MSWSGERSRACAEVLSDWLPKVINAIEPWMSAAGIDKGARWNVEVSERLSKASFGILCLTSDNLHNDWILFEAGAISKSLAESRTCTFLLDLKHADVEFPLAQFQHTLPTKKDVLDLLKTINRAVGDRGISERHFGESLEVWWPRLESALIAIPAATQKRSQRSERELLEELLTLVRERNQVALAPTMTTMSPEMRDKAIVDFIFATARDCGVQLVSLNRRTVAGGNTYTIKRNLHEPVEFFIPDRASLRRAKLLIDRHFTSKLKQSTSTEDKQMS